MLFSYNIDEIKNINSVWATAGVVVACSPYVCVGFLWVLLFPPLSQRCAPEVSWHVPIIPVSVSVGAKVCELE